MASPVDDIGHSHQHQSPSESTAEPAFLEAQKWIEAVTGRCFGDKDFRGGLENGILLCELLSSVKPGLVKKINRLPTPIAGVDNLSVFLRGCEELGLKGSQLFDPGDLQDTSTRPNAKIADGTRKLKNVLITLYWLGRAANSCISYSGPTLELKEFEGLLSHMRKEVEELDSPRCSVRDSGYVDCWDSERSDSLSPPRHARDDSFDSLDSLGSRSPHTPSPDALVARGNSDGRGSDSESDAPHRKLPDVRKDDMLARRTSVSEPRAAMPFNQYLPNKSNQSGYVPTPLRRRRADREEGGRKSWSTATSPIGGDRPFRCSFRSSVSDDPESVSMIDMRCEEDAMLQPHSQTRHQLLHQQYQHMKEDEDHWQDDLARWKSRRRSVSQDLIKKEEERKMMEQLMTGGGCTSQRRKSIKTYREIVEEKERREDELRQAYRSARSPEEAASVLHRYALRFTISEAVLERLQLPRLLDCSTSTDPSLLSSPLSPSTDDPDGPLRYLRQQSLPAPRFTAMVEAQVEGFAPANAHRPQIRSPDRRAPPRALSPKPVPLLTPQPYLQSKPTLANLCTGKTDSLLRVNGDVGVVDSITPDSDGSPSPLLFHPSPATPTAKPSPPSQFHPSPATATAKPSPPLSPSPLLFHPSPATPKPSPPLSPSPPAEVQTGGGKTDASEAPPTSLLLQGPEEAGSPTKAPPRKEAEPTQVPPTETVLKKPEEASLSSSAPRQIPAATCSVQSEHTTQQAPPMTSQVRGSIAEEPGSVTEAVVLAGPGPAAASDPGTEIAEKDHGKTAAPGLPLATRPGRWSRDPEEERRRQESWQREQERMLQEKYEREQEKLKQEWETAQREVEEDERRHHQEEQRILEETVGPLTPLSPLPSSLTPLAFSLPSLPSSLPPLPSSLPPLPSSLSFSQNSTKRSNGDRRFASVEKLEPSPSKSPSPSSSDTQPPSPSRSVSGKKLCSSCGHPLGKGAAMIIETLSLFFHIQCFKVRDPWRTS
ncbi:LOW QUALITY PROTEIN: LIM and calponin homology domains-containing protein 1 [Hypomesus transpacificus]|uniref:LOW QUALITY PROTEIN: LIM and calponin homology domains-containing protein 1 n=1 Tax=Hypomesus transpacificus TaxID=137520 RepID=UPI001F07E812|nr:LOW QUALITY PROTEIN: LIM and calponin homology domains-containing protein 1 [Hypomesus transpacificus]